MDWTVVALVALVGAVALGVAWSTDRTRSRSRAAAALAPPQRHIPTLDADAPPPAYVPEAAALTRTTSDQAAPPALVEAVARATGLPGGWAHPASVTDSHRGWAVVGDPLVLVCTGVGSFRELLPAVTAAKRADRPLVVVAPAIEPAAMATLAANAAQGHLRAIAVTCRDLAALQTIATAIGATIVRRGDLQSGWLPITSYGSCATWVSDQRTSWALPITVAETPQPEGST